MHNRINILLICVLSDSAAALLHFRWLSEVRCTLLGDIALIKLNLSVIVLCIS